MGILFTERRHTKQSEEFHFFSKGQLWFYFVARRKKVLNDNPFYSCPIKWEPDFDLQIRFFIITLILLTNAEWFYRIVVSVEFSILIWNVEITQKRIFTCCLGCTVLRMEIYMTFKRSSIRNQFRDTYLYFCSTIQA